MRWPARETLWSNATAGPTMPDLPEIHLRPALHNVVDEVIASLRAAPNLFHSSGRLVRLRRDAGVCEAFVGDPYVVRVSAAGLTLIMSECATYWSARGKRTRPPKYVASMVLARREWPGVPCLPLHGDWLSVWAPPSALAAP